MRQMTILERRWSGRYMVVEAPKKDKNASEPPHDDYPDSLMMLVMGVNDPGNGTEVEMSDNVFFGTGSRGHALLKARARFGGSPYRAESLARRTGLRHHR